MPELINKMIEKKRAYEKKFIATVFVRPAEALANYSDLTQEDFIDLTCKEFWKIFLETNGDVRRASDKVEILSQITAYTLETPTYDLDLYADRMKEMGWLIKSLMSVNELVGTIVQEDISGASYHIQALKTYDESHKFSIVKKPADIIGDFAEIVENAGNDGGGISTGIPKVDKGIGKLQRTWVSVLASRTNIGKTALAMQFAFNAANQNHKTLYISTESRAVDLWMRRVLGICGIQWKNLINGEVSESDKERLQFESQMLADKYADTIHIDDHSRRLPEVRASVAKVHPDIVVLDHLDEMRSTGEQNRVEFMGDAMNEMKAIAKDYNCHVMIVHQIKRLDQMNRRPELSDLRWSGDIEQKADIVCMLYREDIFQDASERGEEVKTEFWIKKHRMAKRDVLVELKYNLKEQWFRDGMV